MAKGRHEDILALFFLFNEYVDHTYTYVTGKKIVQGPGRGLGAFR